MVYYLDSSLACEQALGLEGGVGGEGGLLPSSIPNLALESLLFIKCSQEFDLTQRTMVIGHVRISFTGFYIT